VTIEEGIGIDQDPQLQNVESYNLRQCMAWHVMYFMSTSTCINGYNIDLISSRKSSTCLISEEEVV